MAEARDNPTDFIVKYRIDKGIWKPLENKE